MRLSGRFLIPLNSCMGVAALVVLVACLAGCGGGEDATPTQVVPPEPMVVPNGSFAVTATSIVNQCGQPNSYNTDFDITLDGTSFTMGTEWTGSWDAIKGKASGESPHDVQTYRDCTVRIWTEVDITFKSADAFSGNIIYRRRVSDGGSCNTDCLATWGIGGVRK